MNKLLLMTFLAVLTQPVEYVFSMEVQKEEHEENLIEIFAKKYAPPKEICALIEKNKQKVKGKFGQIEELPGFFIKDCDDVYRAINAARMKRCIKKNNLMCFDAAQKYVYKIDDRWVVIAEYIDLAFADRKFTLEEVNQLAILLVEIGFNDFGANISNIRVRSSDGKIVFMDTEHGSLSGRCRSHKEKVQRLRSFEGLTNCMNQDAAEWVNERLDFLENNEEQVILIDDRLFPDDDMDYELFERQLRAEQSLLRELRRSETEKRMQLIQEKNVLEFIQEVNRQGKEHPQEIDLTFCYVPERAIEKMEKIKNLKKIVLRGARCDFLEKWLETPEMLEELDLTCSSSKLTCDILQCFKKFQALKFLNMSNNQNISLEDVGFLKNLEVLSLGNCGLTRVPEILNKDLPKLRVLDLSNNRDLEDLKGLEKIETLEKLLIRGCSQIKREHIEALQKQLPNLEIISDVVVLEIIEAEEVVVQPHSN